MSIGKGARDMEQKKSVGLRELQLYLDGCLPDLPGVDGAPNGLQVEGKKSISKIGTAVSANLATLQMAVQSGVDALIVHHGLFWFKDSFVVQGGKREKLALLLQAGISLFAYHLPLDLHPEWGNNWRAAREMGWRELEPFYSLSGHCIGVKGVVEASSPQTMQAKLEKYYQHPATVALGGKETIQRVGLISGGAHKAITQAAEEGLDAFITGNFDEPAWSTAFEEEIHFFALGHSATERVGPRSLALHLQEKYRIPCEFLDAPNPF